MPGLLLGPPAQSMWGEALDPLPDPRKAKGQLFPHAAMAGLGRAWASSQSGQRELRQPAALCGSGASTLGQVQGHLRGDTPGWGRRCGSRPAHWVQPSCGLNFNI